MSSRKNPELKPIFVERMKMLLSPLDFEKYKKILGELPLKSIRCNTIKISPEELKKRLEKKGWKIILPWKKYPEVMIVENELEPGELGRTLEHLLGYYYIQELSSMLPIIALEPKQNEILIDLCASPGSKTTQAAASMKNTGTIIANEISLHRIKILASNLERCGIMNTIITRKDGAALCKRLKESNLNQIDKILVDAPCSGEGTLRSSPKTYLMWNIKTVRNLPKIQSSLLASAIKLLKKDGEIVYSTCTHAPEENEGVINNILKKFSENIKLEEINLPIKFRGGITEWQGEKYSSEVKKCARIYPHDNNTEGFFIAKFRKIK